MLPTLSLIELLCTLIIYTHEGRDIATFDVPGAYRHTKLPNDKRMLVNLRGDIVYITCKVNTEYNHDAIYKNGKMCYAS